MVPSPRKRSGKESVKNADKDSNNKGSNSKTTKSKKRTVKAHGLASQDQIHKQRRNKMLLAVLIYIGIGAGVLLWKGLTKLPEIPPELESEILRSYPEHLKDIEMPKNIKKKSIGSSINPKEHDSKADLSSAENDQFHFKFLNKISLSPLPESPGKKSREWKEEKPEESKNSTIARVYFLDEFLSPDECDKLVNIHEELVKERKNLSPLLCFDNEDNMKLNLKRSGFDWADKVTSKDFLSGSTCLNATLSTLLSTRLHMIHTTSHYSKETELLTSFENAIQQHTGLFKDNGGQFQIASFDKGDSHGSSLENEKSRFASVLVYLNDIKTGGEVEFAEIGVKIKPRKSRIVVWQNMNSNGEWDPTSTHRLTPIVEGKGFILQRWYHYKSFPNPGKRPSPPTDPQRPHQFTPRVLCSNSQTCHWYDEWS